MTLNEKQLHPVVIAQVILNFFQRHGVERRVCLADTGLSESRLSGGEGVITRAQEMRLIENALQAFPAGAALGFELGLEYSLATFGVWGFALRTSETLRDAIVTGVRYLPLSTAYCAVRVIDSDDEVGIRMDPSAIPERLRPFLLERDMATGVNLLKELSLSGIPLRRLVFARPPGIDPERAERLCGIRPSVAGQDNLITVDRAQALLPLPSYDPDMMRLFEDQCRVRLRRISDSGLEGRVRRKLIGDLGLGATLEQVAASLAMSSRTLRRKLENEGFSYREIVEEERRQLAVQFLENTSISIDELAWRLGYSDSAGFVRAFQRWFGCSPGRYRESGPADER